MYEQKIHEWFPAISTCRNLFCRKRPAAKQPALQLLPWQLFRALLKLPSGSLDANSQAAAPVWAPPKSPSSSRHSPRPLSSWSAYAITQLSRRTDVTCKQMIDWLNFQYFHRQFGTLITLTVMESSKLRKSDPVAHIARKSTCKW
jgi:hypothetical protein